MENEILNIDSLNNEETSGTPEGQNTQEAFRIFKTQEEFQRCIDKALGKRLSRAREQDRELSELREDVKNATEKLGISELSEIENVQIIGGEIPCEEDISKEIESFSIPIRADELIRDQRFCKLLKGGASVKDAVTLTHFEELIQDARENARAELMREIRLKGLRPEEDASLEKGSFSAGLDVRFLTQEQRNEIRERVRRGERVTF